MRDCDDENWQSDCSYDHENELKPALRNTAQAGCCAEAALEGLAKIWSARSEAISEVTIDDKGASHWQRGQAVLLASHEGRGELRDSLARANGFESKRCTSFP